jgi:cysteine desulfurase
VDARVLEEMREYFDKYYGNPHADDHSFGWHASSSVAGAAKRMGGVLGCDADEIIFTSGATEANNLAILGLAEKASASRRRILVSAVEHKSVLEAASGAQRRFGCSVHEIPVDATGAVLLHALERQLSDDVLLVSVMNVNNEIGTIQPLAEIRQLTNRFGAYLHTDGTQGFAAGVTDLSSAPVDLLSLSGHKFYGPKGIGALYVRRAVQPAIEAQIVGGGQQNGLRAGTLPVPLCVGLAHAAELMVGDSASDERTRIAQLRDRFARRLLQLEGAVANGPDLAHRHPGNFNVRFDGCAGHDLLTKLQPRLAASTGSACTSGTLGPSHVLTAIGLDALQADASIRFSFGRFSTEAEIDEAAELVSSVVRTAVVV